MSKALDEIRARARGFPCPEGYAIVFQHHKGGSRGYGRGRDPDTFTVGLSRREDVVSEWLARNDMVLALAGGTKDEVLAKLGDLGKVRRQLASWTRSTKKELREAREEVARLEKESARERKAARAFLALVRRKPEEVRS